jgi:hypothetical protein
MGGFAFGAGYFGQYANAGSVPAEFVFGPVRRTDIGAIPGVRTLAQMPGVRTIGELATS